ncbi:MAG: hypothetical protein MHPSP_004447, partial [Paramarteilia canceri]
RNKNYEEGDYFALELWDYDMLTKNDFIGCVTFSYDDLESFEVFSSGWYVLELSDHKDHHIIYKTPQKVLFDHVHANKTATNKSIMIQDIPDHGSNFETTIYDKIKIPMNLDLELFKDIEISKRLQNGYVRLY